MLLLTLGLPAWCGPFCTSRVGTASCLCSAASQCASWALPGEPHIERGVRSAVIEGQIERESYGENEERQGRILERVDTERLNEDS